MTMSGVGLIVRFTLLGFVSAAPFATSCAAHRAPVDEEVLVQRRMAFTAAASEASFQSIQRVIHRLKAELDAYQQGHRTEPPILEVLIISGGGDFGAFGAGFLTGWGSVTDPQWKRPHFDIVTGVSTGALIAPFAFLGDDASYERAERLYREPRSDWVQRRGLFFFMPSQESFLRIDGLTRDIEREFDETMIQRVAAAAEGGRLLAIGTTNLDLGRPRAWDVGHMTVGANPDESRQRMVRVLLASSAIPGAFPAVELDGYLYADGALSSNILYDDSMRASRGMTGMWVAEYPGVPMPVTRFWVIINGQLEGIPQITQPTWVSVTAASISTASRRGTTRSLQNLASQLELINRMGIGSKQMRVVSVPSSWRAPGEGRFSQQTMQSLADLGAKMGADPASWQTVVDYRAADQAAREIDEMP